MLVYFNSDFLALTENWHQYSSCFSLISVCLHPTLVEQFFGLPKALSFSFFSIEQFFYFKNRFISIKVLVRNVTPSFKFFKNFKNLFSVPTTHRSFSLFINFPIFSLFFINCFLYTLTFNTHFKNKNYFYTNKFVDILHLCNLLQN